MSKLILSFLKNDFGATARQHWSGVTESRPAYSRAYLKNDLWCHGHRVWPDRGRHLGAAIIAVVNGLGTKQLNAIFYERYRLQLISKLPTRTWQNEGPGRLLGPLFLNSAPATTNDAGT